LISFITNSKSANIAMISIVSGIILGYIIGKTKDKKKYRHNQQI
jgi:hypothetical protein